LTSLVQQNKHKTRLLLLILYFVFANFEKESNSLVSTIIFVDIYEHRKMYFYLLFMLFKKYHTLNIKIILFEK